jgi:hypothetical protein
MQQAYHVADVEVHVAKSYGRAGRGVAINCDRET